MNSPVNPQTEIALVLVIVQLTVIIACARSGGFIFHHLGQPQVCEEIAGGLILGPSFFGGFFPGETLVFGRAQIGV